MSHLKLGVASVCAVKHVKISLYLIRDAVYVACSLSLDNGRSANLYVTLHTLPACASTLIKWSASADLHCALQEGQQQTCLLESIHALVWLRQLDQQVSPDSSTMMELLSLAASVLAEAGTLGLGHGAFLHTCLRYISSHVNNSGQFWMFQLRSFALATKRTLRTTTHEECCVPVQAFLSVSDQKQNVLAISSKSWSQL